MKSLKNTKTSKLFFDKYVYKIVVFNPLSFEFRDKNLHKVYQRLQKYALEIGSSANGVIQTATWNKKTISRHDCDHAIDLCHLLTENLNSFTIRIESSYLGLYSNNEDFIDHVKSLGKSVEISRPENEKIKTFLLNNPHSIVSKKYTHKYRITVNPLREVGPSFHSWAENIPTIKLLKRTYRTEGYFYAANEKTLGMCRLFLGGKIRRIDTMYVESEI